MPSLPFDAKGDISRRCPQNATLELGMNVCSVILTDGGSRLCMPPPGKRFTPPEGAVSCIVSLEHFTVPFGMKDVFPYTAAGAPGHTFSLGFHGVIRLRFAHSVGFSNLLRRKPDISADALFPMLENELTTLVASAMAEVLGAQPVDYQQILSSRPALQNAIEEKLFWHLYAYGLCIVPHSFIIKGFSRPVL